MKLKDLMEEYAEYNVKKGAKTNGILYKQAGNSMPIPVLESIFMEMLKWKK